MKFEIIRNTGLNTGQIFIDLEDGKGFINCGDTLDPRIVPPGNYVLRLYASPDWTKKSKSQLPYFVLWITGNGVDDRMFEIHPGSTLADSKACLMVGDEITGIAEPMLSVSAITFAKIMAQCFLSKTNNWDLTIK